MDQVQESGLDGVPRVSETPRQDTRFDLDWGIPSLTLARGVARIVRPRRSVVSGAEG
jgi:hypothetical protein